MINLNGITLISMIGATANPSAMSAQDIANALPGIDTSGETPTAGRVQNALQATGLAGEELKTFYGLVNGYSAACKKLAFGEGCTMCQGKILMDLIAIAKKSTGKQMDHTRLMEGYVNLLLMERQLLTDTNDAARSQGRRLNVVSRIKLFDALRKNPGAFSKYLETGAGRKELYDKLEAIIMDPNIDLSNKSEGEIVQFILNYKTNDQ